MAELARLPAVAQMVLRPGWLRVEPVLPPVPPGCVSLFEGYPEEVPLELVPPDLRPIGSRFVIVFEPWGPVLGIEREDKPAYGGSLPTPAAGETSR